MRMEQWCISNQCVPSPDSYVLTSASDPLLDESATSYGTTRSSSPPADKEKQGDTHREISQVFPAPSRVRIISEPRDYLSYAILSTIFCCFPLGIPAIYYSVKVKRLITQREMPRARRAALKSRQLIQMAVAFGMIIWFIALIVVITFTKPRT